jgi:anthranilate synthase/aminodeoxychorismate synthase-like glutamine amidotransferase
MKTLLIDNYDSFTYNLYQYLGELGGNPIVKRNDKITLQEIIDMQPTHIVISPGPGHPKNPGDFGVCAELITSNLLNNTPLLGVCLGHQGLVHYFGGEVVKAPTIMHGKESFIVHDQAGLYKGVPSPLKIMRYHSFIAKSDSLPEEFEVTAATEEGLIMGIRHRSKPLFGVQYHPESIATEHGKRLLQNFLKIAV